MRVDFKITTWERVWVPKEQEADILAKLESGEITSAEDLLQHVDANCEKLFEVEEQMTPKDNGGCATIEAVSAGVDLFNNGIN